MGGHHHGHDHAHGATALDRRLWWSVLLNVAITAGELVGGLLVGSLALIADALHNLGDVASLLLAIGARAIGRRPPSPRFTYGLKRVEVFSALINAAVLLGVSGLIAVEAVRRLGRPDPPSGLTMIVLGALALAGNGLSVLLLRRHGRDDVNVRSAVLHLLQDALASVVVIAAGLLAGTRIGPWVDPVASLAICAFVLHSALAIAWETVGLLAEATPRGIDIEALATAVERRFAPTRLHHLHVWEVGPGQRVLTAHLAVEPMTVECAEDLCGRVRAFLRAEWSIDHATLEPEVNGCGHEGLLPADSGAGSCWPEDEHGHGHGHDHAH